MDGARLAMGDAEHDHPADPGAVAGGHEPGPDEGAVAHAGDAWGSAASGAMVTWSPELRIENAGGAWVGTLSGVFTSATGEMLSAWFEGTGAYEGLSFFEWIGVPGGAGPSGFPVMGLLFPGKPPVLKP